MPISARGPVVLDVEAPRGELTEFGQRAGRGLSGDEFDAERESVDVTDDLAEQVAYLVRAVDDHPVAESGEIVRECSDVRSAHGEADATVVACPDVRCPVATGRAAGAAARLGVKRTTLQSGG